MHRRSAVEGYRTAKPNAGLGAAVLQQAESYFVGARGMHDRLGVDFDYGETARRVVVDCVGCHVDCDDPYDIRCLARRARGVGDMSVRICRRPARLGICGGGSHSHLHPRRVLRRDEPRQAAGIYWPFAAWQRHVLNGTHRIDEHGHGPDQG